MTSQGVFPARPAWRRPEPPEADEPSPRTRYAASDLPALIWRERWLMLAVFIGLAALGVAFALTLKTVFPTHASVLVKLGQEYVYQPRSGDAGRGAVPDNDQLVQSEAEIMGSDVVKLRVVQRLGVARLDPADAKAYAAGNAEQRALIVAKIALGIGRALKIDTAPGLPIVRLGYQSSDPQLGAQVLNTLLEEYLAYRRTVLMSPTSALTDQRRAFQARLDQEDAAYQSFLASNQIGDFDADKTALSQLSAQIEQQQLANDTALKDKTGRLSVIEAELAGLAPEVVLYHDADPTAQTKLADLKVQRESLLSRYKADAQPVKDMDAQIAQLEAGIAAGRTAGKGAERTGVNPVYETFETEKLQLAAEVDGLRQTAATLTDEMSRLTERRLRLAKLEPQYQTLSLDRDALANNVKDLAAKAAESEASEGIAAATNDNIRIVERAQPAAEGKSLKKPVLALGVIFAAFTALCAGLLRMFLRPGLPTPASAGRTLDLPVLGAAPLKQPA
ncbi:MAG TPA: Wzz/FepE/Etk N-terminal domain-containing protein [Caulobacteraceae bacterium]|nr:Wzz/FepE/Etk N-terminal domain-containing protein [Caulobacteraceae bacterium]